MYYSTALGQLFCFTDITCHGGPALPTMRSSIRFYSRKLVPDSMVPVLMKWIIHLHCHVSVLSEFILYKNNFKIKFKTLQPDYYNYFALLPIYLPWVGTLWKGGGYKKSDIILLWHLFRVLRVHALIFCLTWLIFQSEQTGFLTLKNNDVNDRNGRSAVAFTHEVIRSEWVITKGCKSNFL